MKQVEPSTIFGVGHLAGIAAITGKQRAIARDIEMDRPFVALQVIPKALGCGDFVTGEPEILPARSLEVVPNPFAVRAEKFVPGDFVLHGAFVNECKTGAIRMDGPDAIHQLPWPLMAKHDKVRIRRGK